VASNPPRVEIILPTGGAYQTQKQNENWQNLLAQLTTQYPALEGSPIEVERGKDTELVLVVKQRIDAAAWTKLLPAFKTKFEKLKDVDLSIVPVGNPDALIAKAKDAGVIEADAKAFIDEQFKPTKEADITAFVKENYKSTGKKDVTTDDVERIKKLIEQVGSLEFRILANKVDDAEGVKAASDLLREMFKDPLQKAKLDTDYAEKGLPPPTPLGEFPVKSGRDERVSRYAWVELSKKERQTLGLNNAGETGTGLWSSVAAARLTGEPFEMPNGGTLIYSRPCVNKRTMDEAERSKKKFEYFHLTRLVDSVKVGGAVSITANADNDNELRPVVAFRFNSTGATQFERVTRNNTPSNNVTRHLAIILDGQLVSAPTINSVISDRGQITMGDRGPETKKRVDQLVAILRAGALPAALKPKPVSENTIGPTLGQDTIVKGTASIGLAFVAVLAFMVWYYRFAGLVACVALLANLLLTIAFMVLVSATFTLPGLAGLVLMLGMAVDANVLIYERLREERDRGASISAAIRNGYERAFPTIIDTHLSSIFTAVVLYAVGNDQLKGFGVSLTAGLVISLFTSLYMTRLMFDIWQAKGWLTQMYMKRFFSRPSIDFMSVRYYWFTGTAILTIAGLALFVYRGSSGLNVDFVGGTVYGGKLQVGKELDISALRDKLSKENQDARLAVKSIQQTDEKGRSFTVEFVDGQKTSVVLANEVPGTTNAEREEAAKQRLGHLPDTSVEQIFLGSESNVGGKSRYFTVRTTEKEREIVEIAIDRLFTDKDGPLLEKAKFVTKADGKDFVLEFKNPSQATEPAYVSRTYIKTLLDREFARVQGATQVAFELKGVGAARPGTDDEFTAMRLTPLNNTTPEQVAQVFANAATAPAKWERLENFDGALASETRSRAAMAILASWVALLLYLWFRFGNWTFGTAAVVCLFHDLFFTLGLIAACHYVVAYAPAVANFLLISDFKIDLTTIAALLTLVGYSVNDKIVVFDRIREVRGKSPHLTPQMINDSINQTLSRTILAAATVGIVVLVLYIFGGDGLRLFSFVMVCGVIIGTYSSIYIASPLLLMFGEGAPPVSKSKSTATAPKPAKAETPS
jgi:SecD/SecF fusion protein